MLTMKNQLVRLLVTLLTVFTALASASEDLIEEKSTKPRTRGGSKLAKGIVAVIVVVAIVGIVLFCLTVFCIFKCLRSRKSTKTAGFAAPVETKPDIENQNYYAGNNAAPGTGYNQPPYDPNANGNQYGAHQNEYNAGYNNAAPVGTGANAGYYNQQQGYAPPSGAPAMPVPPTGHY